MLKPNFSFKLHIEFLTLLFNIGGMGDVTLDENCEFTIDLGAKLDFFLKVSLFVNRVFSSLLLTLFTIVLLIEENEAYFFLASVFSAKASLLLSNI